MSKFRTVISIELVTCTLTCLQSRTFDIFYLNKNNMYESYHIYGREKISLGETEDKLACTIGNLKLSNIARSALMPYF